MCDYQGYEFGAGHYPDSLCHEGYLYDADGDGIPPKEDMEIPCPKCNREKWKEWRLERLCESCQIDPEVQDCHKESETHICLNFVKV